MRSVILGLAIILSMNYVNLAQVMERQKLREKALSMLNECQKAVGASDEDVQILMSRKLPTTHEGQCLIECVLSNANLLKDGKINREEAAQVFSPVLGGATANQDKINAILNLCEKEVGDGDGDKCKMAKMFVECAAAHDQEFGIELPTSEI